MISIEEFAILKLKQIEEEFESIVSLLLPYRNNLKAYSLKFTNLIMNIASTIETIFKEVISSDTYDVVPNIQQIRGKNKKNG